MNRVTKETQSERRQRREFQSDAGVTFLEIGIGMALLSLIGLAGLLGAGHALSAKFSQSAVVLKSGYTAGGTEGWCKPSCKGLGSGEGRLGGGRTGGGYVH